LPIYLISATLVCTAAAQTGPQPGFVNKLGTEVDVRFGGTYSRR